MKTAPLICIDRHRLTIDGEGVTTLVAFHGCPLHCKYCLNPQCLEADGVWQEMDTELLMMNVEMLGTNTMVMPVVMPGMASGTSTRERMWNWLAPRSCAASMTLWSIFTIMV